MRSIRRRRARRQLRRLEVDLFEAEPGSEPIQDDLDDLDVRILDPGDPARIDTYPGHARGLLGAADIALVSRVATYRGLADYERTWEATPEICASAFAEVEPLLDRIRAHLVATGWSQP